MWKLALSMFQARMAATRGARAACERYGDQSQIRSLEKLLGKPLFRRLARKVELTADGLRLFHMVKDGLDIIELGVAAVRRDNSVRRLECRWFEALFSGSLLVSFVYPNLYPSDRTNW